MIEASGSRLFLLLSIFGFLKVKATPHSSRIIGGEEIKDEIIPFIVSLQENGGHKCGGSIINERTILLAAHCLDRTPLDSLTIHVGDTTLSLKKGKIIGVEDIHRHPNFDMSKAINDIAIVRLKESLQYNERVKPIALIDANTVLKDDSYATVYGWGQIVVNGLSSEVLKFARMILTNREICRSRVYPTEWKDQFICAGAQRVGTCQGDSGGPLVQNDHLIGIVSVGYIDCEGITVYSNVQYFLPWIKETLSKKYGEKI